MSKTNIALKGLLQDPILLHEQLTADPKLYELAREANDATGTPMLDYLINSGQILDREATRFYMSLNQQLSGCVNCPFLIVRGYQGFPDNDMTEAEYVAKEIKRGHGQNLRVFLGLLQNDGLTFLPTESIDHMTGVSGKGIARLNAKHAYMPLSDGKFALRGSGRINEYHTLFELDIYSRFFPQKDEVLKFKDCSVKSVQMYFDWDSIEKWLTDHKLPTFVVDLLRIQTKHNAKITISSDSSTNGLVILE